MPHLIRIATRKSRMALWQANFVAALIQERIPGTEVALVPCSTRGDEVTDRPLADVGGKALFVKSLELALLNDEADMAVHCLKDVPSFLDAHFTLACYLERQSPYDALVATDYDSIDELPSGAYIGTSSPRRQAMLLHHRPDLNIEMLRGNVDTRLRKLDQGEFDAIILAECGLRRMELDTRITQVMPESMMIPAVGQGIIAIETLSGNHELSKQLQALNHEPTQKIAITERQLCQRLDGNCHSPIGSFAKLTDKGIQLTGAVGSLDGEILLQHQATGDDPVALGNLLADKLLADGAKKIME